MTAVTNQKYRFTGKLFDDEQGIDIYYYGARYYDPNLGRFMATEPLLQKYESWCPYAYALDNPISLIDSDGRESNPPNILAMVRHKLQQVSDKVHTFVGSLSTKVGLALGIGFKSPNAEASVGTSIDLSYSLGSGETTVSQNVGAGVKVGVAELSGSISLNSTGTVSASAEAKTAGIGGVASASKNLKTGATAVGLKAVGATSDAESIATTSTSTSTGGESEYSVKLGIVKIGLGYDPSAGANAIKPDLNITLQSAKSAIFAF